jgi:hypothetical protein
VNLNEESNFINKVSKMTDEELNNVDLQVFLVSKAQESDDLYFSKKEHLDPELRKWLKKSIKKELNKIKVEDGEQKKFYISEYSHELTKPDYIAKLVVDNDDDLKHKKDKLLESFNRFDSDFIDKDAKFQVIKLYKDSEVVYFIFYRGVKISAMERRNVSRVPTVRDREQLVIQDKDVIEFGGKIELFIQGNFFYIINPRTLEYAFNYDDHIKRQRDKNLSTITKMTFFDDYSNTDKFVEMSSQYILSRGLASIKVSTLEALEESFDERCRELKDIKERIPREEEEKQVYQEKFESLWPLYQHIDVENHKVRFNPNHDVIPLLHFFSDKIVESFLTKKIKSEV